MLDFLHPGHTLVVTRIYRLAGSMKDLRDIVHELKTKGVALKSVPAPREEPSSIPPQLQGTAMPSCRSACASSMTPPSEAIYPIERSHYLLEPNAWELKGQNGIVLHVEFVASTIAACVLIQKIVPHIQALA